MGHSKSALKIAALFLSICSILVLPIGIAVVLLRVGFKSFFSLNWAILGLVALIFVFSISILFLFLSTSPHLLFIYSFLSIIASCTLLYFVWIFSGVASSFIICYLEYSNAMNKELIGNIANLVGGPKKKVMAILTEANRIDPTTKTLGIPNLDDESLAKLELIMCKDYILADHIKYYGESAPKLAYPKAIYESKDKAKQVMEMFKNPFIASSICKRALGKVFIIILPQGCEFKSIPRIQDVVKK